MMQDLHQEKRVFGPFYYRFPDGESQADCYDRASLFLESMYRSWEENTGYDNCVVVGHGAMILVPGASRATHWRAPCTPHTPEETAHVTHQTLEFLRIFESSFFEVST